MLTTTEHGSSIARFRLLRQHGMSVTDMARHTSSRVLVSELRRARVQLPHDGHPGRRRPRAADAPAPRSSSAAGHWPTGTTSCWPTCRVELPAEPEWARTNWQSFWVRLPDADRPAGRHAAPARRAASRPGAASCAPTASPPTRPSHGGPERAGWPRASARRIGASCFPSTTTSARSSRTGSSPRSARRLEGPDARLRLSARG